MSRGGLPASVGWRRDRVHSSEARTCSTSGLAFAVLRTSHSPRPTARRNARGVGHMAAAASTSRTPFKPTTAWLNWNAGAPRRPYPHRSTEERDEVTELTDMQTELNERSETDYSDLSALFINCTLKRSPEVSNTQGLCIFRPKIMRRNGVAEEQHPRGRPPDRDRCVARHDTARLGCRRVAGDLHEGDGGRHPRPRDVDLARREVLDRDPDRRAPLWQLAPAGPLSLEHPASRPPVRRATPSRGQPRPA